MNENELKKCPFCGGKAEVRHTKNKSYIVCFICGCRTKPLPTVREAIRFWNQRSDE